MHILINKLLNRKNIAMGKVLLHWGAMLLILLGLATAISLIVALKSWYALLAFVLMIGIFLPNSKALNKAIKAMEAHQQSGIFWLFTLTFIFSLILFCISYYNVEKESELLNWHLIGMVFSVLLFLSSFYHSATVLQVIGRHIP